MKVWSLQVSDWDAVNKEYTDRYTRLLSSSIKARREAVRYLTLIKNCDAVETNNYSKAFYTVSAKDMSGYCVIKQELVE